ncbi:MAG: cation transporter [Candidatus Methylomirabilales bacterium]
MEGLDGVSRVEATFEKRRVVVTYDPDQVTIEKMIATIIDLGYQAQVKPEPPEGSER